MLSNPPFGVEWKKAEKQIKDEIITEGGQGDSAGLPAISDGSFLFLQHMISKMKRDGEGSKIGIDSTVRLSSAEERGAEQVR